MKYLLYADESGVDKSSSCYTIGAILVPEERAERFSRELVRCKERHKITSEIKWENVRTSYNVMNFALDLLQLLLQNPYVFTCIVVRKDVYRKWRNDEAEAFYTTYTMLIENCTKRLGAEVDATLDEKSESYDKHHEVVQIIANHRLEPYLGQVASVVRADSKDYIELQAVDILTGAVNAAHDLHLNPNAAIHKGKILLLERLSSAIGWDRLHYDTYPNAKFNIWHFPRREYRAVPGTMQVVPSGNIRYVTREDIQNM